jgi:zinc transporter ZupT
VKLPVEDEDDDEDVFQNKDIKSKEHDDHGKQDWKKVDMVAWILLLCISFECLIEGIAFALTLSDELGAGIAILAAMIFKLIPQKLGDAVILR